MRVFLIGLAAVLAHVPVLAQLAQPINGAPQTAATTAVPPRGAQRSWDGHGQIFDEATSGVRWIVGAEINTKPDYFGRSGRGYGVRPVLALEWGRFHASTGGGRSLMEQGRERYSSRGASIESVVRSSDRFNVSLGMSIDRGRGGASSERLLEAPKIPATARLRVKARYFATDQLTATAGASQDILGKHGGLKGNLRLIYEYPLSQTTTVTAGLGAALGNGAYMRSQYGIPDSPAYAFPAFRPKAGLFESDISVDVAHALSRHWVAFGGLGYSQLHGDAKRSPLTLHSSGASLALGIAWRN